ncbi:uncharacterized protein PHACADRAFT_258745 [Phanerochaete carnosa HHB-10118-sp]|uniref:Peptidase A1 domain-containing protein n=1 Tax=Phanerochaete carnosa (strain HHB-10118-sp) TaxID=650164 RepID=K5VT75_PHACS|nr:uncharacterized protein PHACADRAFT_258745 [Phanerochaete carnosa HHB-10118-sp]EKM54723.1 hypothetical protein PHACADRAFT_258745 [Phanerochaete carnosa HHB-10118-sp]
MHSILYLPLVLAAVQFSTAKTFNTLSRRALTQSNLAQHAENIILVTNTLPGLFLDIDVSDNEVIVQVDLTSADLVIGGQLNGVNNSNLLTTAQAEVDYSFFNPPVDAIGNIPQTTVSIGGNSAQQAFILTSQNPFTDIENAFPQSQAVGVLGFGPTGASSVHSVLAKSHSPIDQVLLTNATNPFITILFLGSELANGSSSPAPAGFFSVGEVIDLQTLLPNFGGTSPPDLSVINSRSAISLGIENSFTVDQILLNGASLPVVSSIQGTTPGEAVAIIAGTCPYNLVPAEIAQAFYSGVSGATLDSQTGLWHVPCGTNLTVEVVLADSTVVMDGDSVVITLPGTSQCVGSFKVNSNPSPNWDISFGTTFLENAYILLGYSGQSGQTLTSPIMKVLPYADIGGADEYYAALTGNTAPQPTTTRFTTVTFTHTPTTTIWLGSPTPTPTSGSSAEKLAGALDAESSSSNAPSGSVGDQLKHCLPAIIALAVVVGLFLVGMIVYYLVSRRRKSGVKQSAYSNIHFAETTDHSRTLYGHDEDMSKYSDPYTDHQF